LQKESSAEFWEFVIFSSGVGILLVVAVVAFVSIGDCFSCFATFSLERVGIMLFLTRCRHTGNVDMKAIERMLWFGTLDYLGVYETITVFL